LRAASVQDLIVRTRLYCTSVLIQRSPDREKWQTCPGGLNPGPLVVVLRGKKFLISQHVFYGTYNASPGAHSHGCRKLNLGFAGDEDHVMDRFYRYLSSLLLAAALLASAASMAHAGNQGDRRDDNDHVRYYDRDHRDYHNWDDHEDRAYRRYLTVQHRSYRQYHRQHYRVQKHYWNWRHSHPDRD
jgi:hypothetical protein